MANTCSVFCCKVAKGEIVNLYIHQSKGSENSRVELDTANTGLQAYRHFFVFSELIKKIIG